MSDGRFELGAAGFARREFGGVRLGDPRRARRLRRLGEAMALRPGLTLPQLFDGDSYSLNAAYDFFKRPEATVDAIQGGHRWLTRESCARPGVHLLLEDTSEISFGARQGVQGLTRLKGKASKSLGFLLHSVLAVSLPGGAMVGGHDGSRPPLELEGLIDQQYTVRYAKPQAERANRRGTRQKTSRPRESDLWTQATERIGPAPPSAQVAWVRVADRGSDIYEFMTGCTGAGHGFIVRASQNRILETKSADGCHEKLLDTARQHKALGTLRLSLRSRPASPAREATLAISAGRLRARSPQRPGHGDGTLAPLDVTVVRVWEPEPPASVKEPLEWILLASAPASTFDEAREIALRYTARWLVEDFHKALKTGLGAERLQLESAHRLFAAIAVMSIVALRLVNMRELVRLLPDIAAEQSGLDKIELAILRRMSKKPVVTARDALRAIAKLGGFLGRKGDGEPGMLTLWLGFTMLMQTKQGVILGAQMRSQE